MVAKSRILIEAGVAATPLRKLFTSMPARMSQALEKGLRNYGRDFIRIMKERRLANARIAARGLVKRSGNTARALQLEFTGNSMRDMKMRVWFDPALAPGAITHELGAGGSGKLPSIKPKRSKYLTIPLDAAKTDVGVARGKARDVGAEYERTFVRPSKSNPRNKVLFGIRGGKAVPLFALVPEVIVPARLGFMEMHETLAPVRKQFFAKVLRTAAEGK